MPTGSATIGFHCSHEQLPPAVLLQHVKLAAEAGFTAAMCSDHFHPWSERQGESGFAWSWLGAALQGTSGVSFGTVCAPGQRYHPAVIAQAAATLAAMFPQRFWLAIGSGEALNEAITGAGWPSKSVRNARLEEVAKVVRALWAGDTVTTRGHTVTESARLYSRPEHPPLLLGAALSPATARAVASWADGLITLAGPRDFMQAVVDAFREGGGAGKPMFLQVPLSFAPTDAEAVAAAHDQWRHCALTTAQLANLRSAIEFDRACDEVDPRDVVSKVRVSADIQRHIDWLHEDCALGFAHIYLHNVARQHQLYFLDVCGSRLLPWFARISDKQLVS
jgi:coenzyme F420-dependent glucose-6-phosphate dehydrogenase